MTAIEFCPRDGTPRAGTFRYCRACGLDFAPVETRAASEAASVPRSSQAAAWITFVGAVIVIVGFVWIWVNTGGTDFWVHVFFLIIGGTIWLGIVGLVIAVLGMIGALGVALTLPFWRRKRER